MPLRSVFDGSMTWREAWDLTQQLLTDPSSHVAAAVAGLKHPWPRDVAVLADLWDVIAAANSKRKPKPYPRPAPEKKLGRTGGRSQQEIRAALAARAPAAA